MEITLRSKFGLWNQININWQIYFQKFFWVASCFIKQGWAHSHNFENLVQLVSESGGKEIQMHLLTSPKNATYLSPAYLAKYTSIMNEYIEVLLLKSLIKGHFYTVYNDETKGISTTEQLAIYSTFEHKNKILEHYLGIIPMSQLVGSHLTAQNVLKAITKYLFIYLHFIYSWQSLIIYHIGLFFKKRLACTIVFCKAN